MYGQNCDTLKRDNEYLRDELDRQRREESERQDREWQAEKDRKAQRQREREEALCYASDWSEAFENGICRVAKEAREELKYGDPDMFFNKELEALQIAQKIYHEKMRPVQEELERIRREKEQAVLDAVAAEVEKTHPKAGVIESLKANDYESLVAW